jgi:alpha-1,3-glucan synthase
MLWSASGIALYVPVYPQTPIVGALLSRSLWLWLGVLDALQGLGFGIVLLQTLTRFHVAATLCASQVLGSATVILAKATSPTSVSLADVFPNFGLVGAEGLKRPWFWVGLLSQLLICAGFAKVFRKEQLFKP